MSSFEVGNNVEWIKHNLNSRDWYGTILAVDVDKRMLQIEWVVRAAERKIDWSPMDRIRVIESIPVVVRKSKKDIEEVIATADLPATYFEWEMDGKCYASGNGDFVGYSTPRPSTSLRKVLKEMCQGCSVMIVCRSYALQTGSVGWWGGMDEMDRLKWVQNLPEKEE